MTTDIETAVSTVEDATHADAELTDEIEHLVELRKEKVIKNDHTPCPACASPVHIRTNECPYCDTNIAANNALVRETLRRIDEIAAELDAQHGRRPEDESEEQTNAGAWDRIKNFFSASPPQPAKEAPPPVDYEAPDARMLSKVSEGDLLKVVAYDGAWYKVKTRDGQTGWVYSTLVKDR